MTSGTLPLQSDTDEDTKEIIQTGHVHITAEMQGNQQRNKETLHKCPNRKNKTHTDTYKI